MKTIVLATVLLSLSGCAALQAKFAEMNQKPTSVRGPYIAPVISQSDADEVAMNVAQFLAAHLPPARTTLVLPQATNQFHMRLVQQLMVRGFGVVQEAQIEGEVPLMYIVTPFDRGVLVRLRYGGTVATRYLPRGLDGRLSLDNKYAVRGI